jgi:hypothetical protein
MVVRRECFQGGDYVSLLFYGLNDFGDPSFGDYREARPVRENSYAECDIVAGASYQAALAPSPFDSIVTWPINDPAVVTYPTGEWKLPNALWNTVSYSVEKPLAGTGTYYADSDDFPFSGYLCLHRARILENNTPSLVNDPDAKLFSGYLVTDPPSWNTTSPYVYLAVYDSWVHFQSTYKDKDGKPNTAATYRVRILLLIDLAGVDASTPPTILAGSALSERVQAGWEWSVGYAYKRNWVSGNPYLGETLEFEDGYYTAVPTYTADCESCFIRERPSAFNILETTGGVPWYYCRTPTHCSWGEMWGELGEQGTPGTVNNTVARLTLSAESSTLTIYEPRLIGTGSPIILAQYAGTPADCAQQSELSLVYGDSSELGEGVVWPDKVCITPATTVQRYQVCDTPEATCNCCDKGGDTLPFTLIMTGCSRYQGTYSFAASRYRSPAPLPNGVSYPGSAPCGVFWATVGPGGIACQIGTGTSGPYWAANLGLLAWCDGTSYRVEAYCAYLETAGAGSIEWVSQGEGTVSDYECLCNGTPRFQYTLPELDCCCETELIVTDCCPDGVSSVLAIEFFNSSDPSTILGSGVLVHAAGEWTGVVNFCGEDADIVLTCEFDGFSYYWNLFTSNGFNVRHSGLSCDPLLVVFQTIMSSGPCFGEQIGANVT